MDAVDTVAQGSWLSRMAGDTWTFLVEAKAELYKITWPTIAELKRATLAIVILAVALGVAIGWLDKILSWLLVDGIAQLTR